MKSFNQFSEQAAAAAAPAPMPKVAVAKAQAKAKPKVTDPSTGVDIDPQGRWKGDVVDQGKELESERKVKVKDGVKGPDPNLPTGEANPNKKREDELLAQGPRGFDRKPGSYSPSNIIPVKSPGSKWRPGEGYELIDPLKNSPFTGPGLSKQGGKGTQIAAGGNPRNTGGTSSGDPNNIQWPRNKYPNKKAPPGPGYRPPTA
tara:strand:+ start:448 stop:1053 length:606 start_codon:yes stop_codon:yes gene_type:complete